MHFSSFNVVMINSCLKSDTVSADRFDNMTCSYILLCGRNPWSVLKWQLTELQIWSCQEPFPLFYIENRGFDVPDELCCNKCVSIEEITSTLRRYKQCSDKTTAFDAIFDYANEANKQGYRKNIHTKEEFNTVCSFSLKSSRCYNNHTWDLYFTKENKYPRLFIR